MTWKGAEYDGGTEGAGRVEGAWCAQSVKRVADSSLMCHTAGEEHASELGDEECETNADRCEKSALVLLCRQHEDSEDQLCRQKHLDDCDRLAGRRRVMEIMPASPTQPLRDRSASTQSRCHVQRSRKEAEYHSGCGDGAQDLRHEDNAGAKPSNSTNQGHTQSDGWIEELDGAVSELVMPGRGCSLTPPVMRKNTQALTARLNPKASEMYSSVLAFGALASELS